MVNALDRVAVQEREPHNVRGWTHAQRGTAQSREDQDMSMNLLSAAQALRDNRPATFIAHGNSMTPLVKNGQKVTIYPLEGYTPIVGDVVLAKVKGRYYLHKVTAIGPDGRFQISNNRGHINGWAAEVLGVLR